MDTTSSGCPSSHREESGPGSLMVRLSIGHKESMVWEKRLYERSPVAASPPRPPSASLPPTVDESWTASLRKAQGRLFFGPLFLPSCAGQAVLRGAKQGGPRCTPTIFCLCVSRTRNGPFSSLCPLLPVRQMTTLPHSTIESSGSLQSRPLLLSVAEKVRPWCGGVRAWVTDSLQIHPRMLLGTRGPRSR